MSTTQQKNYASYKRSEHLSGLELLTARFDQHRFRPHFHDGYAIGICESGRLDFKCNGREYTAYENDVMVVHPSDVHEGSCNGIRRYRMVYPDPNIMGSLLGDSKLRPDDPPTVNSPIITDPRLASLFLYSHEEAQNPVSSLSTQTGIFEIFKALFTSHGSLVQERENSVHKSDIRIKRCIDYIHEHFSEEITLIQLSEVAELSPYYLLRNFKKITGFSPHSYQLFQRVRVAKELLLGEKDTAKIAVEVGFYDQSHFVNRFRSVFGFTPQKFRDEVRSNSLTRPLSI